MRHIIFITFLVNIFVGWSSAYDVNKRNATAKAIPDTCLNAPWGYNENAPDGPKNWSKTCPVCDGDAQSPINLEESNFTKKSNGAKLSFNNYGNKPQTMRIINNGHTVQLIYTYQSSIPSITGGPLNDIYQLEQVHFHWGSTNDVGSEHYLNGKQYAMEAHLVHFNKKYGTFNEALNHDDGISVVGFFYTIKQSTPYMKFVKYLYKIIEPNTMVMLNSAYKQTALSNLFGNNAPSYVTYRGSLTTPPCTQNVQWIVALKPLYITPNDIAEFRKLKDSHGGQMVNNYRQLQSLNDREIFVSDN